MRVRGGREVVGRPGEACRQLAGHRPALDRALAWHLLPPTRRTASDYRMTPDQWKSLAVLIVTIGLLIWGRFRHDLVALAALLATTLLGLVPTASAFAGFGHPAVITVAGVLVMSAGLEKTGAVAALVDHLMPRNAGLLTTLAALASVGALLSAFMNNVGALALLMPAALAAPSPRWAGACATASTAGDLARGRPLDPAPALGAAGRRRRAAAAGPRRCHRLAGGRPGPGAAGRAQPAHPQQARGDHASALMLAAIAGVAFGLVPSAVAFALGALDMMALRIVDPDAAYRAVDWPVVVLLGAMMPVAGAIESTGLARVIATGLIDTLAQGHAVLALTMILVVTMTLPDFMNNAATAAVMCPIALGAAGQLDAQPQSFLMAVAIGASCAFLTPIGHQNNTLILGPGGLKFGDYWRLGLSLEIVVVLVAVPMLLWVWPL